MIATVGKDEIIERSTSPLQPRQNGEARGLHDFKLNRLAGLPLNDDRARLDCRAADNVTDLQLHEVAATAFTVDGEIEQSAIPHALLTIKVKVDRPYLLDRERALGADTSTGVPWSAVIISGDTPGASRDGPPDEHPPPTMIESSKPDLAVSMEIQIDGWPENIR